PSAAEPAAGLGARQARSRAARALLRAPLSGADGDDIALRAALRAGRPHLLHFDLRPPRGARADGLRSAGAAAAPGRRARRPRTRAGARAAGGVERGPAPRDSVDAGVAPRREDPGPRAASGGLPGRGVAVVDRARRGPWRLRRLRALPVPG